MKTIFKAKLSRPAEPEKADGWTFIHLPQAASDQLPSRSMVSIEGTLNGFAFQATLDPDGLGGHWLKVMDKLRESAGVRVGEMVSLEIAPVAVEPEPEVPEDFLEALKAAPPKALETWKSTTAIARRDWIQWLSSGKRAETRGLRIEKGCDMLASGKRRICCFDRSGKYGKGATMTCPVADED